MLLGRESASSPAASGTAGTNLRGAVDIHTVTFFVGPRYTYNIGHISPTAWNRKGSIFVQGKFGYAFATSGQYPVKGVLTSNASSLDLEAGGGVNLHIYHRFDYPRRGSGRRPHASSPTALRTSRTASASPPASTSISATSRRSWTGRLRKSAWRQTFSA